MFKNKRVAVFLSARELKREYYSSLASAVGKMLGKEGYNIVYGGGYSGTMGVFARAVEENNSRLLGITTKLLLKTEAANADIGNTLITESMAERKNIQLMSSDYVVVLPGGFGTMDELFEAITLNQLRITNTKIFILDKELEPVLKKMINLFIKRGTIHDGDLNSVYFVSSVSELKNKIKGDTSVAQGNKRKTKT